MDAVITVSSLQKAQGETNKTEIITEGTYERKPYGYVITYDETDSTGYEGAHTTLRVFDSGKVELTRSGSVSSELLIEPLKKNYCHYGTPYGEMIVGIYAKEVISSLTLFGGVASAKYVMDVNSNLGNEYELSISV